MKISLSECIDQGARGPTGRPISVNHIYYRPLRTVVFCVYLYYVPYVSYKLLILRVRKFCALFRMYVVLVFLCSGVVKNPCFCALILTVLAPLRAYVFWWIISGFGFSGTCLILRNHEWCWVFEILCELPLLYEKSLN